MRRLSAALALTAALIAAVVPVGAARAAGISPIYTQVLHAYMANGRIPPCEFTSPQLQSALNDIDTYGQQYFADFIGAIQTALTARASGACAHGHGHGHGGAGVGPAGRGGSGLPPGTPALPPSVTASTSSGLPFLLVVLVALGAVLVALAALVRWVRATGREPRWATRWRHGAAEARYRTEGRWLEFTDRLRR